MGLFGIGKKNHQAEEEAKESEEAAEEAAAEETNENVAPGEGVRGENQGPWDVDDENIPDFDEYLDLGSLYLPFIGALGLKGRHDIALHLKADRKTKQVLSATVSYGKSSLEMEALAAPKSHGLWDDVRADLKNGRSDAKEVDGVFGHEVIMPVKVGNKTFITRIVGVDGPRWMLRGIFSGPAAEGGEEKEVLDKYFANMVVDRGEEPLAPHDKIPMHAPVTPAERRKQAEMTAKDSDEATIPGKPDGPLTPMHQVEQQTTLQRGPLFSEMR